MTTEILDAAPRTALDALCDMIEAAHVPRPTGAQIVQALADHFNVEPEEAFEWIEFGVTL